MLFALNLCVTLGLMLVLWLSSLALRDASIVDRFWGAGFVLVSAVTLFYGDGALLRSALLTGLVAIWGLRLSLHLTRRNWGEGEDYRYQAMRRSWGDRFWLVSLGTVFLLQGLLLWIVSLPVQKGASAPRPESLTLLDALGVALWLVGFTFEAVADAQLRRFLADPENRGRVMDRGLWRYTRHPNYFGDAVVWWGLFSIALATPGSWWTVASPLAMTFLLTRVSGVPMLERRLLRSRPGYAEYVARTSAFFPWPPKKTA